MIDSHVAIMRGPVDDNPTLTLSSFCAF